MKLRYIAGGIAALVAGGLVLAMEIWTVVPAPNRYTLVPAVAIPELGPWGAGCCAAAIAIAQLAGRGWPRTFGTVCAALALGFALVPWCLLPASIAAANTEMRLGLGANYADAKPPMRDSLLARPYDPLVALAGYRPPDPVHRLLDRVVRTRDGALLGLDVYMPVARGTHPTVVLIYGGAWIFGSRAESAELARSIVGLGYTAIAIDYRHAPAFEFPTQLDDLSDGLTTIARHADQWGVDVKRVALFGQSAGAELALLGAYASGPLTIRAAIGYYAPTDLVLGYRIPPRPDPVDVRRILRAYLGGTPDDRLGRYIAASPTDQVRPGLPPTLLICGMRDELVRISFEHELRDLLRRQGNRVVAIDVPWSNHAFDSIANGTGGQFARYYTQRFLAATL